MAKNPHVTEYSTPWSVYSLAWSPRQGPRVRLAIGSCIAENSGNHIHVLEMNTSEEKPKLTHRAGATFTFPPTKLMWSPDPDSNPDVLASSSTTIDLWKHDGEELKQRVTLVNQRKQSGGKLAPLTSFDWSAINMARLGCSSVDTTCAIWNVEKQQIETQFIAHDKAVNDVQFAPTDSNCLASAGADGSLRTFDLRNLESSLIVYEKPGHPFLRVAWNKVNSHLIATTEKDGPGCILMDLRRMSKPLSIFPEGETLGCVNALTWAPHSQYHLMCGMHDGEACIWDVKESAKNKANEGQELKEQYAHSVSFQCPSEIYSLQWPLSHPGYVAIGMENQINVLQV